MKWLVQITSVLLISSCSHRISEEKDIKSQDINESIRKMMHSDDYSTFSGSILVTRNGKIIAEQNYGFIDINRTSPITSQSKFNVGSAAKEIPGVAILDLVREGKIKYQDTLNRYLSYLPAWAKKITIKNILFYESGLPDMNLLTSNSDENAISDIKKIDSLLFEPGSDYLYSNWNNFLQAQLVEAVVGSDFQSYISRKYFEPLKMDGASYTSNPPKITENITKSYNRIIGEDSSNNPNFKAFELCFGPLYMTPLDLLKWIEYVHVKHKRGGVGAADFFEETNITKQGSLGVIKRDSKKVVIHEHGGIAYSFETLIYRNYKDGTGIIIMTNCLRPHELEGIRDKILEIMQ